MTEYAPLTTAQKKKVLGLNAAKMYDIPVPAELQLPDADEPAGRARAAPTNLAGADDGIATALPTQSLRGAATPWSTPSSTSRSPTWASSALAVRRRPRRRRQGAPAAADVVLLAELRLPDGLGRQRRPGRAGVDARRGGRARRPPRLGDHQRRPGRRRRLPGHVRARGARSRLDELRATFQRKAHTAAMERCLTGLLRADPTCPRSRSARVTLADLPAGRRHGALLRRRAALGLPTHRALVAGRPRGPRVPPKTCRLRAAPGPVDPHLDRRQRALLPRSAAHPLRARRRGRSGRRRAHLHPRPHHAPLKHEGAQQMSTMRAVQVVGYHPNLEMTNPGTRADRAVRRRRQDRRRRACAAPTCTSSRASGPRRSRRQLPYTIGHENAGWVDAVG